VVLPVTRSGPQALAQFALLDPVDEHPLTVELDHRQPGPVLLFERRDTGDVDLVEREWKLVAQPRELGPDALAERAMLRVVDRDDAYG
jgi:hypothetical protein